MTQTHTRIRPLILPLVGYCRALRGAPQAVRGVRVDHLYIPVYLLRNPAFYINFSQNYSSSDRLNMGLGRSLRLSPEADTPGQ